MAPARRYGGALDGERISVTGSLHGPGVSIQRLIRLDGHIDSVAALKMYHGMLAGRRSLSILFQNVYFVHLSHCEECFCVGSVKPFTLPAWLLSLYRVQINVRCTLLSSTRVPSVINKEVGTAHHKVVNFCLEDDFEYTALLRRLDRLPSMIYPHWPGTRRRCAE